MKEKMAVLVMVNGMRTAMGLFPYSRAKSLQDYIDSQISQTGDDFVILEHRIDVNKRYTILDEGFNVYSSGETDINPYRYNMVTSDLVKRVGRVKVFGKNRETWDDPYEVAAEWFGQKIMLGWMPEWEKI